MSNYARNSFNSIGVKREHPDGAMDGVKKNKPEHNASKVIHLRNLPANVTELEVQDLGRQFGRVTNHIMMRAKNQAFIELDSVDAGRAMINHFTYIPAKIGNNVVYAQFSAHQELKLKRPITTRNDSNRGGQDQSPAVGPGFSRQPANNFLQGSSRILKVIVSNIKYPVDVDVLDKVFNRCGVLQKIVTFVQNDVFTALIQYRRPEEAINAKNTFDRQNIYNGCNTLSVELSNMVGELSVQFNNDKMRDFTNPNLPSGENNFQASGGVLPTPPPPGPRNAGLQALQANAAQLPLPNMNPLNSHAAAVQNLQAILQSNLLAAQQLAQTQAPLGRNNFPGDNFPRNDMQRNDFSPRDNFPPRNDRNEGGNFQEHRGASRNDGGPSGAGSVLLCSNLNEDVVNCEDLFILFGVYGDVLRVKILFNKKDTALVQFADAEMAANALANLTSVPLHGQEMRVSRSKHTTINMPNADNEGNGFTKDYSNSPLHRFKNRGSKNWQNIFKPISTLHLSNIPETSTEDDIKAIFAEHGTVNNFHFFPKDRRMALIQMASTEEAVKALIRVHNTKLDSKNYLRVSFAKSEM